MTLVTPNDVRIRVQTSKSDADLQDLINDEEAEVFRRYGPHADGELSVTETHEGGARSIFLHRPIVSVTSVTDNGTSTTGYTVYASQGRVLAGSDGRWGGPVVVTYVPQDDRARRRSVIIELVRLALEQTAMRSESVAGEYSYQAPDWEVARAKLYRRIHGFQEV